MNMKTMVYGSLMELVQAAERLLRETLTLANESGPYAVLLSGGNTPGPIYRALANQSLSVSKNAHVFFTDDRYVPLDSEHSNYALAQPMLKALSLDAANIHAVPTDRPLEAAAREYDDALAAFGASGGRYRLALLGLGTDGHTCSLFTPEAAGIRDRLAIPVTGAPNWDRVSVTATLLDRVERIVVLAAGEAKREMIHRLEHEPESIPAGIALQQAASVEIWTDPAGRG
jgi:6-phosphogluconolactonase